MKKLKIFIVVALFLLASGVVFAKGTSFGGVYALYAYDPLNATYYPLSQDVALAFGLTTSFAGSQAAIVSHTGFICPLWGYNVSTGYEKLYTTF